MLSPVDSAEKGGGLSFPIILTIVLVGSVIVFAFLSFVGRLIYSSRKAKKKQTREGSHSQNSRSKNEEERIGLNEPNKNQEVYT